MRNCETIVAIAAVGVLLAGRVTAGEGQKAPEMTPAQKAEMEAYMKAGTPGAEHKWLASAAGNYTVVSRNWSAPDAKPSEDKGTAKRSMVLDGRVMVEEFTGAMTGAPFRGQGMMGFDNVSGKYWSTWLDSMSTGLFVSEGTCDAKHACTFAGSWNDPITRKPRQARIVTRWSSPTTEAFEMWMKDKQGKEYKSMEMIYTKLMTP
jgi:Protein of unknown function (DUF1579)